MCGPAQINRHVFRGGLKKLELSNLQAMIGPFLSRVRFFDLNMSLVDEEILLVEILLACTAVMTLFTEPARLATCYSWLGEVKAQQSTSSGLYCVSWCIYNY